MKTMVFSVVILGLLASFAMAGTLYIEGPDDRGEGPIPEVPDGFTKCKVTVDVYGQGFFGFGRVQTALRFIHREAGDPQFTLEEVIYNEEAFPQRFGIVDPLEGIAGFVKLDGDVEMPEKTWLYSLVYSYRRGLEEGFYDIEVDAEKTTVGGSSGQDMPFDSFAGALDIGRWRIPGDANLDCKVNILDLVCIRNRMNQDPGGDPWPTDVNQDDKINILDLIFVRNHLNTTCEWYFAQTCICE